MESKSVTINSIIVHKFFCVEGTYNSGMFSILFTRNFVDKIQNKCRCNLGWFEYGNGKQKMVHWRISFVCFLISSLTYALSAFLILRQKLIFLTVIFWLNFDQMNGFVRKRLMNEFCSESFYRFTRLTVDLHHQMDSTKSTYPSILNKNPKSIPFSLSSWWMRQR